MERLWSPWRMRYIRRAHEDAETECLFCRVMHARSDRAHLVLARRAQGVLLLNRYPYNPGHLMVATGRHVGRFARLRDDERHDLLELTALAERALELEYRPHGLNVGVNLAKVAGAGFPGHLHLHLVPRWNGDTNFMPVVAATRVLPETLGDTWARLRRAVSRVEGGRGSRGRASR